ncbi:helix-turn-helix transcriptional regulator [Leuconostoc falkenbergense]|uniref:helix-turn-helix domain-containing protein n=1 Tax=Leuconostoc falkenbergense TaxID=2766470 RepID=UPI0024AD5662|nr:helix-turn-helix transcriptional regulator [Leuconostoc falkenbergense]MDI6668145.1 helix-turn-helix transcriptional regulator [Leuconostoc falkenbergense]
MENFIGPKIKEIRQTQGLTQFQLAEFSNVSLSLIAKIETENKINIKIDTLINISNALNINLNDLIENKKNIDYKTSFIINKLNKLDNTKKERIINIFNQIIDITQ